MRVNLTAKVAEVDRAVESYQMRINAVVAERDAFIFQLAASEARVAKLEEALKHLRLMAIEYLDCNGLLGSSHLTDAMIDAQAALSQDGVPR